MTQRIKQTSSIKIHIFLTSLFICGCSFKFELTSQKTALENQIMGSYRELEDDLLVTNFERKTNDSESRSQSRTAVSASVQRAEKNREFNSDDIKELKDSAIIGELPDGLLALLPKSLGGVSTASPEQLKLAEALIDEENRDREAIWKKGLKEDVKQKDPESEQAQVRLQFARDIFDRSPAGHWFFVGSRWTVKQ